MGHIRQVLSITTGLLLTDIDEIYDILEFLTGERSYTHQIPHFINECKPYVLQQWPSLDSPKMDFALGELTLMLESVKQGDEQQLINGWLSQFFQRYGEYLNIKCIPIEAHDRRNPVTELEEMRGKDDVIDVVLP